MKYDFFRLSQIEPKGFIGNQLSNDINKSLITEYDKVLSNLNCKLFQKQERIAGTYVPGNRNQEEKAWWAGEHEGYYFDGMLKMAILTKNKEWIERVGAYADAIMKKYEETGYIGIYTSESRYPKDIFNGELWVQSRIFQMLISWYEYTGDEKILEAIEQTVETTMKEYIDTTYFGSQDADGGVKHAIGYVDTLEWLYRKTKERKFLDYIEFITTDMEKTDFNDLTRPIMKDENSMWQFHTPHIAEGLHLHAVLTEREDNVLNRICAVNTLKFLKKHTNPGGGFVAKNSKEAVGGTLGNGNSPSEYCSKTESITSLNRYMLYQPTAFIGDYIEKCTFNTAQAARFPEKLDAVMYLSRDNQLSACDVVNGIAREIFSSSHKAALCCNLNAIRLMPYYVEGMYLHSESYDEVLVNLYGASELEFEGKYGYVRINQETNYPFGNTIYFQITAEKETSINLVFRVPSNARGAYINGIEQVVEDGFIKKECVINQSLEMVLTFDFQPQYMESEIGGEYYCQWGNLVFGKEIPCEIIPCGAFEEEGFDDFLAKPLIEEKLEEFQIDMEFEPQVFFDNGKYGDFIQNGVYMIVKDKQGTDVVLKPMGGSPLHMVTFTKEYREIVIVKNDEGFDEMRYF